MEKYVTGTVLNIAKRWAVTPAVALANTFHGGVQRFGHIDRHGNKAVRVLLVEAVWRAKEGFIDWLDEFIGSAGQRKRRQ